MRLFPLLLATLPLFACHHALTAHQRDSLIGTDPRIEEGPVDQLIGDPCRKTAITGQSAAKVEELWVYCNHCPSERHSDLIDTCEGRVALRILDGKVAGVEAAED